MSYNPIDRLRKGNVDFLREITSYDEKSIVARIRILPDRSEIVKAFLLKLIDEKPSFCFDIIYDMEEYKNKTITLMEKYSFLQFGNAEIKNILYNTNYGEEYVYSNLDTILSIDDKNRMAMIIEFIYNKSEDRDKWINKLSRNSDLHCRALFILYIIKHFPNDLAKIYDNLPKYMTDYTGLPGEQLTFFPNKISAKDMSGIVYACLESPLDRSVFLQLKEYLLTKYKENDLAQLMLENKKVQLTESSYTYREDQLGKEEFKLDADRLFTTSRNYQYQLLYKYSENITRELTDRLVYYIDLFKTNDDWISSPLYNIFIHGLGKELKVCVDKYLDLSNNKSAEYIEKGSTSHCFRLGDYAVKLVKTKWSYEDIICPNIYPIIKNLEERFIRNDNGIIISGLEVQKYLKKSAKGLPYKYFSQLLSDLRTLGYYTTDSLMGGTCGDNCRILDSYKDADCLNPESLPDYFKELPLVLVDRDRIYSIGNQQPKQLRESMS